MKNLVDFYYFRMQTMGYVALKIPCLLSASARCWVLTQTTAAPRNIELWPQGGARVDLFLWDNDRLDSKLKKYLNLKIDLKYINVKCKDIFY